MCVERERVAKIERNEGSVSAEMEPRERGSELEKVRGKREKIKEKKIWEVYL